MKEKDNYSIEIVSRLSEVSSLSKSYLQANPNPGLEKNVYLKLCNNSDKENSVNQWSYELWQASCVILDQYLSFYLYVCLYLFFFIKTLCFQIDGINSKCRVYR